MCDSLQPHSLQPIRFLSLGFSKQEYCSGLPFPSPVHESEKWKWSRSVVADSQRPHGLQPTRLLHPWDFPGKSTGVGCHRLLHSYPSQMKRLRVVEELRTNHLSTKPLFGQYKWGSKVIGTTETLLYNFTVTQDASWTESLLFAPPLVPFSFP